MQSVTAGGNGQVYDSMYIQIAGNRIRTDIIGLIGLLDVQGMAIRFGIYCDRSNAHFGTGAYDSYGDFSPVGNKDFPDQNARPRLAKRLQNCIFRAIKARGLV